MMHKLFISLLCAFSALCMQMHGMENEDASADAVKQKNCLYSSGTNRSKEQYKNVIRHAAYVNQQLSGILSQGMQMDVWHSSPVAQKLSKSHCIELARIFEAENKPELHYTLKELAAQVEKNIRERCHNRPVESIEKQFAQKHCKETEKPWHDFFDALYGARNDQKEQAAIVAHTKLIFSHELVAMFRTIDNLCAMTTHKTWGIYAKVQLQDIARLLNFIAKPNISKNYSIEGMRKAISDTRSIITYIPALYAVRYIPRILVGAGLLAGAGAVAYKAYKKLKTYKIVRIN